MPWEIEGTNEFEAWYLGLSDRDVERVNALVGQLEEHGVHLGYPLSSQIKGSQLPHLRELRSQGHPLRILYAFDPRRVGILLLGGDKTGDPRWYAQAVPEAERLYAQYLDELQREDLWHGRT